MKKLLFNRKQWHIGVIVIVILILSIVSWLQFAKSIAKAVIYGTWDSVKNGNEIEWELYNKSELSAVDSAVTYYATGEILSSQVIKGKEDWLFYKITWDGNTIADYEGTNRYTSEELEQMAKTALATQKEFENKGIKFAVMVVPNKENVYFEYMPEIYSHAAESSTDIMIDYLQEKGVNIVSPKDALLDKHLESELYFRYDTHWNQQGAYIGTGEVLSAWDIVIPDLSDRVVTAKKLKGNYYYGAEDDLAEMAGLKAVFSDEIDYEVENTVPVDWMKYELEQNRGEISYFYNEQAKCNSKILLIGDSFRIAMVPSLNEQFSDVYVVHRWKYIEGMIDSIRPEYMIIEYAERYSKDIGKIDQFIK